MIMDEMGREVSFANGRREALAALDTRVEARVRAVLGREPEEGEIEQMGEMRIHPNGDLTFCLGSQPILRVFFEGKKMIMEDA
jgi:hypothetical protein